MLPQETGMELSDEEVEELFKAFDKDGEGSVNYDEFITSIRVDAGTRIVYVLKSLE